MRTHLRHVSINLRPRSINLRVGPINLRLNPINFGFLGINLLRKIIYACNAEKRGDVKILIACLVSLFFFPRVM